MQQYYPEINMYNYNDIYIKEIFLHNDYFDLLYFKYIWLITLSYFYQSIIWMQEFLLEMKYFDNNALVLK